MLDPGAKALAVDRAVEHARRGDPVATRRGEEGGGLPVAVRHGGHQPLPTPGPAMAARHVGGRPGLVDQHQALRVQVRLSVAPDRPGRGDVRPLPLGCVLGLFFRVRPAAVRNRLIAAGLTWIAAADRRRRSTAIVRSGSAATSACTRPAWSASAERFQPPYR
jgi:hypothetical protein